MGDIVAIILNTICHNNLPRCMPSKKKIWLEVATLFLPCSVNTIYTKDINLIILITQDKYWTIKVE